MKTIDEKYEKTRELMADGMSAKNACEKTGLPIYTYNYRTYKKPFKNRAQPNIIVHAIGDDDDNKKDTAYVPRKEEVKDRDFVIITTARNLKSTLEALR